MVRRKWIVSIIGLASASFVAQTATSAVWSIEADCEEGDWGVEVEFAGFDPIDASCLDGTKTRLQVDAGNLGMPTARVAAISASGTSCDSVSGGEPRFKLVCGEKTEDADGFELEEEIEVELELEEDDQDDGEAEKH